MLKSADKADEPFFGLLDESSGTVFQKDQSFVIKNLKYESKYL